jgi:hypothetical protein
MAWPEDYLECLLFHSDFPSGQNYVFSSPGTMHGVQKVNAAALPPEHLA